VLRGDHALAERLADEAGALLLRLRSRAADDDPGALRREGDRVSHEFLTEQLAVLRPHDAVLSEEGADDPVRLDADRVWIVDPLDGTREFGEVPRADWAVHVALWERGSLVAGAVARPALGSTLCTGRVPVVAPRQDGPVRLAVSRSRPPEFVTQLVADLAAVTVPMGSAGIKACSVIDGTTDAYVHAGGQYEWDSAAPVAVARAAGLHTSRIDGSPLIYNRRDPLLPDLLICRPELADELLSALAALAAYKEAV
jgi:3'(2'), 5'-bisphosphate nucleotidase